MSQCTYFSVHISFVWRYFINCEHHMYINFYWHIHVKLTLQNGDETSIKIYIYTLL